MKINKTIDIDPELESQFKSIHQRILNATRIAVCGHINPDGDDLGSQLALSEYLDNLTHTNSNNELIPIDYVVISEEDVPDSLSFLPNCSRIKNMNHHEILGNYEFDLIIVVDSGDLDRIGKVKEIISSNSFIINIDHHMANTLFGDQNVVLPQACSVGEILYYFFMTNNIEITTNIAIDLYVSISTDTGSFRYDQMHSSVHIIISDLLDHGVIPSDINFYLTQNKPKTFINLLSLAISRIEYYSDDQIAITYLTHDDFIKIGDNNTDGLIEYFGMVNTVSVYVFMKEKVKGEYSASLRSKFDVNVAEVAQNFSGGGHKRAAGCKTSSLTFDEFKTKLVKLIENKL